MLENKISRSIYISRNVIEGFTRYAKLTPEGVAHHLEKAFIEYMINHPLEGIPIIIQNEVKSGVEDKLKEVQIHLVEKPLRLYMQRLTDKDGDLEFLRRAILKELKRGLKIKNPPDGFVDLLVEAKNLV